MVWVSLRDAEPEAISADLIGGKALGIWWLQSHGFAVPATWVLTTHAFAAVVQAAEIGEHIAALEWATAGQPDWATTERALQALEQTRREIGDRLRSTPLPGPVEAALATLPQGERYWAVRSSATVEDGSEHSFAGQFASFLATPGGRPLADAVRGVWVSTFGKTVLHYRAHHGTAMPRMAVVFQPMPPVTPADRAGVAFSHSPVPSLPGVLLQVAHGVGTTVVGGGGGELKCVRGGQVVTQAVATPEIAVTAPAGGLETVPEQPGPVLSDQEALQLAGTVARIAELYGRPADIEFIWRAGQGPTFLQVRALTN
jgi:pyruvate,water dikinase